MKIIPLLLIFFFTFSMSAQDVILTSGNEEISAKVEEIHIETISYKKSDNLSGPTYHIEKSEVSKIIFENGNEETFDITSKKDDTEEISLEDTQKFIIEFINKYAYDKADFKYKHRYRAFFENDFLRLRVLHSDNIRFADEGKLYDFSSDVVFHRVSYRNDELAFLNIFVLKLTNEKKNKWEKVKLVIRIKGHDEADSIQNALKHYNQLLNNKDSKPNKF